MGPCHANGRGARQRLPQDARLAPPDPPASVTCRAAGGGALDQLSELLASRWLENGIGLAGWMVALLSLLVAGVSLRISGAQFARAQTRENDVRVATSYMQLELASSDIFRFTAEHAELLRLVRGPGGPRIPARDPRFATACEVLRNLYYQTLNLFEVCSRLRRDEVVPPAVFASWVAWFIELIEDRYFREHWEAIRANYTDDVRVIMDVGCDLYTRLPEDDFEDAFYLAVANIMTREPRHAAQSVEEGPCREIAEWRRKKRFIWDETRHCLVESPSPGTSRPPAPEPPPTSPAG